MPQIKKNVRLGWRGVYSGVILERGGPPLLLGNCGDNRSPNGGKLEKRPNRLGSCNSY
jgi:hypothetical protein